MDTQSTSQIPPFPQTPPPSNVFTPPSNMAAPSPSASVPPPPVTSPVSPPSNVASPATNIPSSTPTLNIAPEQKGGHKMLVVLLLVILLFAGIAAYAYYTLYMLPSQEAAMMPAPVATEPSQPTATPTPAIEEQEAANVDKMNEVSTSDDVTSLESDIAETDLSTVKSGFDSLEQEL